MEDPDPIIVPANFFVVTWHPLRIPSTFFSAYSYYHEKWVCVCKVREREREREREIERLYILKMCVVTCVYTSIHNQCWFLCHMHYSYIFQYSTHYTLQSKLTSQTITHDTVTTIIHTHTHTHTHTCTVHALSIVFHYNYNTKLKVWQIIHH